jgi:short-subunit dehydrogenase
MRVAGRRSVRSRNETCLVVGGSSGLGRSLAERFASAGYALALVSSDRRDIDALASDFGLRLGVPVATIAMDLSLEPLDLSELDRALSVLPPLTTLLAAAGMNSPNDTPSQAAAAFKALTSANFGSISCIIGQYLPSLVAAPAGLIVGFGSIAAVRGRTRNTAYSAAKRALQSYFESLRHALSGSKVMVQFYALGYLDTNLAFGQRTLLPPASPSRLAERVYAGRARPSGLNYYPRIWRPICAVVRVLPWFIFRRLAF